MITVVLVFCILVLYFLSVYLFSKADQEDRSRRLRNMNPPLEHEAVLISSIEQGKVQERWCYINDIRSQVKHANVSLENAPMTIEGYFGK